MMFIFYAIAAIAIIAALKVVTGANPIHALLNLIVTLLAIAGLFFVLGAPFAAALEILVYAGAILVLFVFVVMMLNLGRETEAQEKAWRNSKAIATPFMLSATLLCILIFGLGQHGLTGLNVSTQMVSAKTVGTELFSHYILLVEFASLLLLSALIGAYHLAKHTPELEDDAQLGHQGGEL